MLSNESLQLRCNFIQCVRSFFLRTGYIEVDTPVRLPVLLPEAEIVPFTSENWFLQTSPEQCMKRLLAQGGQQLFQVCHAFRKEENGQYHATEFTLLEWYHAGWDYLDLMQECERFILDLSICCFDFPAVQAGTLLRRDRSIALSAPWQRISVERAFRSYAGLSVAEALKNDTFDEVLVRHVEPNLGWLSPTFLYDYPIELGSLAKKKENAPHLAERFELYICGIEVANGFSELIDPDEQRQRFSIERERLQKRGRETDVPEKFLKDLEKMSETAGIALGLDRLLMIFLDAASLAEVMPFTQDEL